ncbi:TRAP transporter small permease [Bacillus solitudinis]|uniref:TRAP transporter small permease n=1 Tax=Bacillus solitudinis TaxID=2014074 RepID=UPI000C249899|nr:TRAP transporter small permease subunit [Bacillus solitudinis]
MAMKGRTTSNSTIQNDVKVFGTIADHTTYLGKISCFFERIIMYLCMMTVGTLCLDLILAVFSRYLFQKPIIVADELALLLLANVTFLGASLSVKRNEMVAVTILIERLGRFYWIAQAFIQALILLFSLLLLMYAYVWITSPNVINNTTAALGLPMWIPYLVFPFSMFTTCIFCLNNIQNIVKKHLQVERKT